MSRKKKGASPIAAGGPAPINDGLAADWNGETIIATFSTDGNALPQDSLMKLKIVGPSGLLGFGPTLDYEQGETGPFATTFEYADAWTENGFQATLLITSSATGELLLAVGPVVVTNSS